MNLRLIAAAILPLHGIAFAASSPADAHTRRTAVAFPFTSITVDADLSDWPARLPTYELRPYDGEGNAEAVDARDLVAGFQAAFDRTRGLLFVAVRVTDDRIVLDGTTGPSWNAQDSCELFVDVAHRPARSQPMQFFYRRAPGSFPEDGAQWARAARAVRDGQLVFEWQIDLAGLGNGRPLPAGDVALGFDVVIQDRDAPGDNSAVLWGPGPEKWLSSHHLGDLLLLDHNVPFGSVEGRLVWQSAGTSRPPRHVHATRVNGPAFFVHASADSEGRFRLSLPPGEYDLNAGDPRTAARFSPRARITVKPNNRLDAPTLIARRAPALEELLPALMQEHDVPGVALAVIEDGRISTVRIAGVGDEKRPVTRHTVFRVASLTKPVSTVIAYKLAARGEWNLDEPLSNYWVDPDVRDDPRHRRLTSRLVLMHRTGLPNWRGDARLSFGFDPGARWGYSGEGFEYMRHAIEKKTGRSFEDLAKDLIFGPAGMRSTSFVWPDWVDARYAGEHFGRGRPLPEYFRPTAANAAANMVSSVEDYARFGLHVLDGAGLPRALFEDMTSPHRRPETDLDGERWGIGWGVLEEGTPEDRIIWHGGGQAGIRTIVMLQPARRRGVVVFTNATSGSAIIAAIVSATLNREARMRTLDALLVDQNEIPQ